MDVVEEFLTQTPWWVWVLFAWVIHRGWKARRARESSLRKTGMLPAILAVAGIIQLVYLFGVRAETVAVWLGGLVVGAIIGRRLLRDAPITADRARGVLMLPPDRALLPILLLLFAGKFAFGAFDAISAEELAASDLGLVELAFTGFTTGLLAGRFWVYLTRYLAAPRA